MDGPQSLLAHYYSHQIDFQSAYRELQSEYPALARVSLSLIPDESLFDGNPSAASESLLLNIDLAPQKKVNDEYAEKLLMYKSIIEVDYSANYIGNDSLVSVIKDKSGIFFVNYLIEMNKFSVNIYKNKYH